MTFYAFAIIFIYFFHFRNFIFSGYYICHYIIFDHHFHFFIITLFDIDISSSSIIFISFIISFISQGSNVILHHFFISLSSSFLSSSSSFSLRYILHIILLSFFFPEIILFHISPYFIISFILIHYLIYHFIIFIYIIQINISGLQEIYCRATLPYFIQAAFFIFN